MDYKAYLSSLFYLTEATKYLSPEQKVVTINQIINLCRQGYAETDVFGFRVYQALFERMPNQTLFDKNYLNKSKGIFWVRDNSIQNPLEKPRVFQDKNPDDGEFELKVELDLINGPVFVKTTFNEYPDDEVGYEANWGLVLTFADYKHNHYTDADIHLLMDRLQDFLPNREG